MIQCDPTVIFVRVIYVYCCIVIYLSCITVTKVMGNLVNVTLRQGFVTDIVILLNQLTLV